MEYYKIIGYIYALLAVGYGTYLCITNIDYYIATINGYYNKNKKETIGVIKNIHCYDKNSCYADIEYIVNNIKYINNIDTPNNLKIGDKVNLKYNPLSPNNPNDLRVFSNLYIYLFIYIILLVIFIILLWIFLIIVIIYPNKYIFIIYAIIITIIASYECYIIINNNYTDDLYKSNNDDYTIGIVKSQDKCYDNKMCFSIIEYLIDDVKYTIKQLTFNYKIGENVKIYYNKNNPQEIKIYDKSKNKREITIIILTVILLFAWICLIFNIPLIIKINNKKYLKKSLKYP